MADPMKAIKTTQLGGRTTGLRGLSTKVPMTSGQGISRKSYQTAYGLGQKGTGAPGVGKAHFSFKAKQPQNRHYGKGGATKYDEQPINVDYGDTMQPPEMTGMMPGGLK